MSQTCISNSLPITVQFGGGAELLFNKVKKHDLTLPQEAEPWTLKSLIAWLKNNLLTEKPELFVQGDSIRPGILILVNDQDWELLGELDYELKENDHVMFISTLHGG